MPTEQSSLSGTLAETFSGAICTYIHMYVLALYFSSLVGTIYAFKTKKIVDNIAM
jgi:hypothetical protein